MFNLKKMPARDMPYWCDIRHVYDMFSYLITKYIFGKIVLYLLYNLVEVKISLEHLF